MGYTGYHFIHQKLLMKKENVSISLTTPAASTPIKQTRQQITKKIEKAKKITKKMKISNPTSNNEPKYDFYRILPATTVTIPTQDTSDAARNNKNSALKISLLAPK